MVTVSVPTTGMVASIVAALDSRVGLTTLVGLSVFFAAASFIATAPNPRPYGIMAMAGLATALPASGVHTGGSLRLSEVVSTLILLVTFIPGVTHRSSPVNIHRRYWTSYIVIVMTCGGAIAALGSPNSFAQVFAKFTITALPLALAMSRLLPNRQEVCLLVSGLVVGITASTGFGLYGPVGGQGRALGFTSHPNQFAVHAVVSLPLLWLLWKEGRLRLRWILILATLEVWGLLLSGSRSGLLALIAVLVLWIWRRTGALSLTVGLLFGFISAVAISLTPPVTIDTPLIERVLNPEETQNSNDARVQLIQEGVDRVGDQPVFGTGIPMESLPHNVVLFVWTGMGLLGLFAFVVFVLRAAGPALLLKTPLLQWALSLSTVAFLVGVFFNNTLGSPVAWFVVGLLQVAQLHAGAPDAPDSRSDRVVLVNGSR